MAYSNSRNTGADSAACRSNRRTMLFHFLLLLLVRVSASGSLVAQPAGTSSEPQLELKDGKSCRVGPHLPIRISSPTSFVLSNVESSSRRLSGQLRPSPASNLRRNAPGDRIRRDTSGQLKGKTAEAKGPILTSALASALALTLLHKEKLKRCCALRLCPCRGQMPGSMGGMFPGMRPGFGGGFGGFGGGFRPGMGGFMPGMGGGGAGDEETNEELQDGLEDSYNYHVRPVNHRPIGTQKRKRPINLRPHHIRPDLVAASASSPETNYPASGGHMSSGSSMTGTGIEWSDGSDGTSASTVTTASMGNSDGSESSADHLTGGMLKQRHRNEQRRRRRRLLQQPEWSSHAIT